MTSDFYNFVSKQLSGSDQAPLYQKLNRAIRESITKGILAPNDYLPSERALMQELGISRKTVRHAFECLREDKVIDSAQGLGTFVTRRINYSIKGEKGFSEIVSHHGGVPSTRWLQRKKINVSGDIARKLKLEDGAEVYQFKRLRFINSMAVSVENSYVYCSSISDIAKIGDSLYQFFKENNIKLGHKESYISAAMPSDKMKSLMDLREDCPLLIVRQLVHSEDTNLPLEYCINYCRSDAYEFFFED